MKHIDQISQIRVSEIFTQDVVKKAVSKHILFVNNFAGVLNTLKSEKIIKEYPEFDNILRIDRVEECDFTSIPDNFLNIEVIVLLSNENVKVQYGKEFCIAYRIWLQYEYEINIENTFAVAKFAYWSIDIKEKFIVKNDEKL